MMAEAFIFFSNEDMYKSLEQLAEHLPEGCVIAQINEQRIDGE